MNKNIVLNNVPNHIKEGLVERGYNVVDSSYEGYVDTILYNSDEGSLSYLNVFDNVIDMSNGALIVDIKEKTQDEIVHIIENRSYSSLF